MNPADLHPIVETAFNVGDVDALLALYEPDAQLIGEDGAAAVGLAAIREVWSGFVALGGQITVTTRYAAESGDLALLSNAWTFVMEGATASAITAEVARRGDDGSWRYVIDNPYGAPVLPAG